MDKINGLLKLADWFDLKDKECGNENNEVQQNLRQWVYEIKSMEGEIRYLYFINHVCEKTNLYYDDGEMQCNGCMIDFKRMSLEDIRNKVFDEKLKLIRKQYYLIK